MEILDVFARPDQLTKNMIGRIFFDHPVQFPLQMGLMEIMDLEGFSGKEPEKEIPKDKRAE